jgi:hypothetical protein
MSKSVKYTGGRKFEKGVGGQRRKFFKLITELDTTIQFGGVDSFKFPVIGGENFSRSIGMNTEINVESIGDYVVFTDLHLGSDYSFLILERFIKLNSTAGSHYRLGTPWVAAADYSISFYVYFIGDEIRVWGNLSNYDGRLTINPDGSINWRPTSLSDAGIDSLAGSVLVDKFSFIRVRRIGATGQIFINGYEVSIETVLTTALNVEGIGLQSGSVSGGLISRPSFIDLTTPANTLEFKLNELTKEYELPVGNVFGSELAINGNFFTNINNWDEGSSTASWDNGTIEIISAGSGRGSHQVFTTEIGKRYLITGKSTIASTAHLIRVGDGAYADAGIADSFETSVPSEHFVSFVAISTTSYVYLRCSVAGTINWDDISVKSVTNILTYQNIDVEDRDTYTSATGLHIGSDLFTQDLWENPQNSPDDIWSFADNKWSMVGDGSFSSLQLLYGGNQPRFSRLEGVVEALSGTGTGLTAFATGTDSARIESAGPFIIDAELAVDGNQQFKRFTGYVDTTLSKPSFKELIHKASQITDLFDETVVMFHFDSTANSHALLGKPFVALADFEFSCYVSSTHLTSDMALNDEDIAFAPANSVLVYIDNPDGLQFLVSDGAGSFFRKIFGGQAGILDGKLNLVSIKRVGGVITARLNGTPLGTTTTINDALTFSGEIGGGHGRKFNGMLSRPNLIDLTTPANTLEFKLNELTKEYELPVGNVFGSELWANPPTTIQTGWSDNGDGSYTHTGGSSELRITTGSPLTPSTTYEYAIVVSGSGAVQLQLGGATSDGNNISPSMFAGTYKGVLKTNSSIAYNAIRVVSSSENTVASISLREVTNYITYENIALEDRDTNTLIDGVYVGSEEITNNTFDSAVDWSPARTPTEPTIISAVNNKLRATAKNTDTFGSVSALQNMIIGSEYSILMSAASNNPAAEVRLRVAPSSQLGVELAINTSSSGSHSVDSTFVATATTMYVGTIVTGQDPDDYVDIDAGISIKSNTIVATQN